MVETYNTALENPGINGAVFFAVCRGKASEGIDFSDHRCRAVVTIGIPFPSLVAPKIQTKRSFMDARRQEHVSTVRRMRGETGYVHFLHLYATW